MKPVQLIELRAHGRFGEVYKGTMITEAVAVKIFPMKEKVSWMMEQDIYKLPHMKHDNVLRFIAAEKRDDKLWLISQFHDLGSLSDYLKGHKLSWLDMLKIGESMAKGLAYLHDDIPVTGHSEAKPSIAHRDFKSKNVLLKSDLTACIADFGLALKFDAGKSAGEIHGLVCYKTFFCHLHIKTLDLLNLIYKPDELAFTLKVCLQELITNKNILS